MSTVIDLNNIDKSYWLTKNKEWVEARKIEWERIERWVVFYCETKSQVNIAKAYFLRGKTPNWEKWLGDSSKQEKPTLDLRLLLWLHPSEEVEVLKPLFKSFIESPLIRPVDTSGIGSFLSTELMYSITTVKSLDEYNFIYMEKKNKVIFDVMFADKDYLIEAAKTISVKPFRGNLYSKQSPLRFIKSGYSHFSFYRLWLSQTIPIKSLSQDSLFQYPDVLEYMYICCQEDAGYFQDIAPVNLIKFHKLFYCVLNVTERHAVDSIYANSAKYLCKMFDEREFAPEFKQMWLDVKSGKIEVENAWER